jgi:hypothetical protein
MRRTFPRWCGGLLPGLLLALGLACSNPEQRPTGPDGGTTDPDGGTASRKPYVVFVVDRSATMIWPIDTANPACRMADSTVCGTQGLDNCDPSRCPTRMSTVKAQLEMFLSSHATRARYGLAFFPATASGSSSPAESCSASTQMRISPPAGDETDRLQLAAEVVLQALRNVPAPAGSTPLGDTLEMVMRETPLGTSAAMAGDVVVILTDGLPNCNADNPYDGTHPECRCTVAGGTCAGSVARLGCLDLQTPVAVLNSLRERGVRTYVLPVGTDALAGEEPSVFNALAEAGGTARGCPQGTNAECGGTNTCDPSTGQCALRFLRPGELDRILAPSP